MKILFMTISMFSVFMVFCGAVLAVQAQTDLRITKHRDMVIDLGDGLKTDARLNLRANGDGPFMAFFLYGLWAC